MNSNKIKTFQFHFFFPQLHFEFSFSILHEMEQLKQSGFFFLYIIDITDRYILYFYGL